MRDCEAAHVRALLQFMYAGQVNIAQAQLTAFLRTADALQIRGLTDCSQHNDKVTVCISLCEGASTRSGRHTTRAPPWKIAGGCECSFNRELASIGKLRIDAYKISLSRLES